MVAAAMRTLFAVVLGMTVLWLPNAVNAAVSAQLSSPSVDELESVRLTIKATDTRQAATLDLSALEQDFQVLNVNTMSQSRYVNGRGQSWVDYQIILQPKRTGTLTIPSISVGTEQTPTLKLEVKSLSAQARQTIDELVFFESEVSASRVYVQAEVVLTRRLLYSNGVQLYSDLPGAPEVSDAVVLPLGETTSGSTTRNGRTYGVVQQRYAVFPERSGTLSIPGIEVTASVRLNEDGRISRKGVRIGTDETPIEVMPVPADYPADQPWLPAREVRLLQLITPENTVHNVGDTLTHELLIDIQGNIGSLAPPQTLALSEQHFRVYPQAPVINDNTEGESVQGSRLQTHSVLPLEPGNLSVPAVSITWWDTQQDKLRVTTAPHQILSVIGDAVGMTGTDRVTSGDDASTDGVDQEADTDLSDAGAEPVPTGSTRQSLLKSLLLAAGVAIGLLLSWWGYQTWRRSQPRQSHTGNPDFRTLQAALASGEPKSIHTALQTYLQETYGLPRVAAMERFRSTAPGYAQACDALLAAIYAPDSAPLQKQYIAVLRDAAAQLQRQSARRTRPDPLPPLYAEPSA